MRAEPGQRAAERSCPRCRSAVPVLGADPRWRPPRSRGRGTCAPLPAAPRSCRGSAGKFLPAESGAGCAGGSAGKGEGRPAGGGADPGTPGTGVGRTPSPWGSAGAEGREHGSAVFPGLSASLPWTGDRAQCWDSACGHGGPAVLPLLPARAALGTGACVTHLTESFRVCMGRLTGGMGGRKQAGSGCNRWGHTALAQENSVFSKVISGSELRAAFPYTATCPSDTEQSLSDAPLLSCDFSRLALFARLAAVSKLPCARNCRNRFLLFTIERDGRSAEFPGSSGFLLFSKQGSGFVVRRLKKSSCPSLDRKRAKPAITQNKMQSF